MKNMDPDVVLAYRFDDQDDPDEGDLGLNPSEVWRLQYFAEHPELADPLIRFLPRSKKKETR